MIKDFLEIGQIVSTHGIRGEVRINPWCDGPDFIKKFKTLYCDDKGSEAFEVVSCRPQGNVAVAKLKGIDTVEQGRALKNKVLYMKRSDIDLPEGKWFISELISCRVIDADDTSVEYGVISDVDSGVANDIWYIKTADNREVLIPAIKDVVVKCDVADNKVYIRPLRGLFDED